MNTEPSKSPIMSVGGPALSWIGILGLVVIAIATVIAGIQAIMEMVARRAGSLVNILDV